MALWPNSPRELDLNLNEIFRHPSFLNASREEQRRTMLASAQWRYEYEQRIPFFASYFPRFHPEPYLRGKEVLDFGCFTGGRGVKWAEDFRIGKLYGTDINQVYLDGATLFARSRGIPC